MRARPRTVPTLANAGRCHKCKCGKRAVGTSYVNWEYRSKYFFNYQ